MKISLKWLSEYVDVPSDLKSFCDRLDLTGTGVEGVESTEDAFANIVTAKVVSKEPHPDSDHMFVCQVDVGENNLNEEGCPEPLQIVCGAQNFNTGDHIVTALIGAKLPGDIKIKKSKLRGVVSYGMNCSARELGLGSDHSGIMILPEDTPIGIPFSEYLGQGDTVLDLEITPNRPDCLSITGFAREVGAMYQSEWRNLLAEDAAKMNPVTCDEFLEDLASVTIEDSKRCPRYTARVIKDVKIGPSPQWLVERLEAIGQRSINNVVDVTNYILFLYGQPLHAFDFDKIKNAEGKANIVVRAAKDGAEFTTLDGQNRILSDDMTIIATPELGAVALAGVMGGQNSEVDENTINVLLESATFEPGRTSRTSRNLGLISESSMRYERRVDDHGCDIRGAAAAALIAEIAGGKVVAAKGNDDAIIDIWPQTSRPNELIFRAERFRDFVGADISNEFAVDVLTRLGCEVSPQSEAGLLKVVPPTFRPDLEREIDLYEEVLRLWGMDRVEPTLPASPKRVGYRTDDSILTKKINDILSACGLNETMTYSFVSAEDMKVLGFDESATKNYVELLNPLNSEQAVMRQTMIPSLLSSVEYNQRHGVQDVALYEIGTVFKALEGQKKPEERMKVAGVLSGLCSDKLWDDSSRSYGFFDVKGIIETMVYELAIPKVRFKVPVEGEYPFLQPGRAAKVVSGGVVLGCIGELHPNIAKRFGIEGSVALFEIDVEALRNTMRKSRPYVDIPVFPAVESDQNFIVDEDVSNEQIIQVITSAGGKLLERVTLFDVFRDEEKIGTGKKSMAYSFVFRAADKTLTQDEVAKVHEKIVKKVQNALGAEERL
jgi:phenylalanyl-tRNA synthetase beta chain